MQGKVWPLLRPDKAKVAVALGLLAFIALGLRQGWVFDDTVTTPPPWGLPGFWGMLAWTVAVYLMVPVMVLNLPLVLLFDLDLFRVPGLALLLAVGVAYLWGVFLVSLWRWLRRGTQSDQGA